MTPTPTPSAAPASDKSYDALMPPTGEIRILHTADLHGQLHGYDYDQDRDGNNRGLAHLAHLIHRQRDEVDCCLLFDSGDFLFGNPISAPRAADQIARAQQPLGRHPIIGMMNRLGFDAAALGNHEFDHGLGALPAALHQMTFPLLLSNLICAEGVAKPLRHLPDQLMLRRTVRCSDGTTREVKIGVLGLTPEHTPQWSLPRHQECLKLAPIAEAAQNTAQQLRQAGADVIVALTHSGIGVGSTTIGPPDTSALDVAQTADVDVLLCGHQHHLFPDVGRTDRARYAHINYTRGRLAGRPATMPGAYGSHLGQIDLTLQKTEAGWRIQSSNCALLTAQEFAAEYQHLIAPYHQAARQRSAPAIAITDAPLHTHFGRFHNDASVQLVARALAHAAQPLLQGRPEAELPLIAAASCFKSGGLAGDEHFLNIPAGALKHHHLDQLYPFRDQLCLAKLTGRELRLWIESSAQNFNTIKPGIPDQPLLDFTRPGHMFDHFWGLNYCFDLTLPPMGGRVQEITWQGMPLADNQTVVVASNSFRMGGAGGVTHLGPDHWLATSDQNIADIVANYIAKDPSRTQHLRPEPIWQFCRIGATSVTVPNLVTCLPYVHEISHLKPELKASQPPGTLTLKLHI